MEQGLAGEEALMGDTPATRLRGGPGEEEGEGLERELRHLETEEGVQETGRGGVKNKSPSFQHSYIISV